MSRKKRQSTLKAKATLAVENSPSPRPPWHGFALVRIRHPDKPNMFYNAANNGASTWTEVGYSIWDMNEWLEIYSPQYPDGRNWDFFGEIIDIWPNGMEGYSRE